MPLTDIARAQTSRMQPEKEKNHFALPM